MLKVSQLEYFLHEYDQNLTVWQRWRDNRNPLMQRIRQMASDARSQNSQSDTVLPSRERDALYQLIANSVMASEIRAKKTHLNRLLFNVLSVENKIDLIDTWQLLHKSDLLTKENYLAINRHQHQATVLTILRFLTKQRLLNQSRFNELLAYPNIQDLASGLKHLDGVRRSYKSPYDYFPINRGHISEFFTNSILFSTFFPVIFFAAVSVFFGLSVMTLIATPIVVLGCFFIGQKIRQIRLKLKHPIEASVDALFKSKHPVQLLEAYHQLTIFERNQTTRALLLQSDYPLVLRLFYTSINKSNISRAVKNKFLQLVQTGINLEYLKQYCFDILGLHTGIKNFFFIDEKRLKFLMNHIHVLTHPDLNVIIKDVRSGQHRNQINRIINEVCEQAIPDQEKVGIMIRRISAILDRKPIMINRPQSTHTSSVHQSVSDSALRFKDAYQARITSPQAVKDIKSEIMSFLESGLQATRTSNQNDKLSELKIRAAIKAARWLFDASYREAVHGIKISEMFMFMWIGMRDDRHCFTSSLKEREHIFLNMLYEMMRGYNIDSSGKDDGDLDRKICSAGCFNKLLEGLQLMQHDLAEIIFISKETANLKLRALTESELVKIIHRKLTDSPAEASKNLLDKLFSDYKIDHAIWAEIEESITPIFAEEYQQLFKSPEEMRAFIAGGKYLELDERKYRPIFESAMTSNIANDPVLKNPAQQGLFAVESPPRRHDSDAAQVLTGSMLVCPVRQP